MDKLLPYLPAGQRLVEPFAGSCSVMMNTQYGAYLIADANSDLIDMYQCIKDNCDGFINSAQDWFSYFNSEHGFYCLRDLFNSDDVKYKSQIWPASVFLFLSRHCFNGLCRYNSKGEFNVPFGNCKKPYFPEVEILAFAEKSKIASIRCTDWREILKDEPLQPSRKKWTNSGYVSGPQRAVAWRVLDAQYFGVAQRRRRVFVVASARTDACPAKILFEPGRMRQDSEPRKTAEKAITGNAGNRVVIGNLWDSELNPHPTLSSGGIGMSNKEIFSQRTSGLVSTYRLLSFGEYRTDDVSSALRSRDDRSATDLIATYGAVRRLTPVKCERLQGFPDNHTQIPWNGKASADCPDGHRYRAIGNSMAVPVMEWIGKRILM